MWGLCCWYGIQYQLTVSICTARFDIVVPRSAPHSVFMCFVWIWEQTAIIPSYNSDGLVFITETKCVYCAVQTGSLYTASLTFSNSTFCPHSVFMCFVWIWEKTAIISLYSINWLVFITETECVYCAVRTGSLYTASLTFSNSTFCPHSVFMCFVWIWEQTAIARSQTFTLIKMRSSLFRYVMQPMLIVIHRHLGTSYRTQFRGSGSPYRSLCLAVLDPWICTGKPSRNVCERLRTYAV